MAETLNLSQLDGYSTGGTVHLIINNQIGFTTLPDEARSTPYSTDVARMVQAPIFHVNGDDPEAAIRVAQVAFDFRQEFKKDVVIDMFCYRRWGHNEGDDPSYTQPLLYKKIKDHPSVATLYGERLAREEVLNAPDVQAMPRRAADRALLKGVTPHSKGRSLQLQELGAVPEGITTVPHTTAVDRSLLDRVVRGLSGFPENFHLHPKLHGFVDKRKEAWRTAGQSTGRTGKRWHSERSYWKGRRCG